MVSYNLYGGTPKKTLDLMKHFGEKSVFYVYQNGYEEFKPLFEATGGKVFEGFYGRNILKHLKRLIRIIDQENIDIIQTQFWMGETLGFFLKLFRPKVKVIITFEGALNSSKLKNIISNQFYKNVDVFIYISKYVEANKLKQFPILFKKNSEIIYNGTAKRKDNGTKVITMKEYSLFDIAGLIDIKNIQILIKAVHILVNQKEKNKVFLYIAGDGPKRLVLEKMIIDFNLENNIFLLGYQTNIGRYIEDCDIFVHPSYAEGFGIAVAEAMRAKKPVIVSNAGALPELIEDQKSGLVINPHSAEEWAEAINKLIEQPDFAKYLAINAEKRANDLFTSEIFCCNYEQLYSQLLNK